jgi:hypothetical protein
MLSFPLSLPPSAPTVSPARVSGQAGSKQRRESSPPLQLHEPNTQTTESLQLDTPLAVPLQLLAQVFSVAKA